MASPLRQELAKFQELIFEDFASFILVENTYEEVVLQSVMKDIMQGRVLQHQEGIDLLSSEPWGGSSTLGWVLGGARVSSAWA